MAQVVATTLAAAAQSMGIANGGLELRRLQTLTEIGVEDNNIVIAMVRTELLRATNRIVRGGSDTAT